jgi:hypothetical protein
VSEPAAEVTPEVQAAYDDLIGSFGAFLTAFGAASAVGIDAGAAVAANLRQMMGDDFDSLPPMVKMLLG